jgi:hypothetical protein
MLTAALIMLAIMGYLAWPAIDKMLPPDDRDKP